jgi:hypothetical protein
MAGPVKPVTVPPTERFWVVIPPPAWATFPLTAPSTAHQTWLNLAPDGGDGWGREPAGFLIHAWQRGEMYERFHSPCSQSAHQAFGLIDVQSQRHQPHRVQQRSHPCSLKLAGRGRIEMVAPRNAETPARQFADQMRPDEARGAGDEYRYHESIMSAAQVGPLTDW